MREEIAALPEEYVYSSDEGIYRQVMSLDEFVSARNIFIYYSVNKEPDTHRIMSAALAMGKTVALPYCYDCGVMEARIVQSPDILCPAMLKIPAPPETSPIIALKDLDLVIAPALACDLDGYRLGYGGGYYDRYLANSSVFTIGLARERLVKDRLPRQPHDIALNCIVTESQNILI